MKIFFKAALQTIREAVREIIAVKPVREYFFEKIITKAAKIHIVPKSQLCVIARKIMFKVFVL